MKVLIVKLMLLVLADSVTRYIGRVVNNLYIPQVLKCQVFHVIHIFKNWKIFNSTFAAGGERVGEMEYVNRCCPAVTLHSRAADTCVARRFGVKLYKRTRVQCVGLA